MYEEEADKTKKKKQCESNDIRLKRITELSEDISELDIEVNLQIQQQDKLLNIHEVTKAISCTEKLLQLRAEKRKMQEELAMLQMKVAKVKKAKKSVENRKAFASSFLKPVNSQEQVDNNMHSTEEKQDSNHEMVEEENDNTEPISKEQTWVIK